MRKSYHRFKQFQQIPEEIFRINEKITVPEVRVIDDTGANVGVMPTTEAIALARSKELDLVEVFPKAQPPVAKLIDYGNFKYWKEKEARKQKARQKEVELKGVRLSLRIGQHDLELRRNQAVKFLSDGNKVHVEIILKGRERQQTDLAVEIIKEFCKSLGPTVNFDQDINKQGGKVSVIVVGKPVDEPTT